MARRSTRFGSSRRSKGYARQKLKNYGRAKRGLAPLAPRGFAPFTAKSRELKVFDFGDMVNEDTGDLFNQPVTNVGVVQPFFIPKLGSDFNQRIGRKVVIKSIYFKWRMYPAWMVTSLVEGQNMLDVNYFPQTQFRVMMVWDTQPNGVQPTIGDILTEVSASGLPDTQSFINMNNRDRFRIILDKFHQNGFQNTGTNKDMFSNAANVFTGKKYKKCNMEVIFNATGGGTIADISSGALYIVALSSASADSHAFGELVFNTRVRYDDA